MACWQVRDVQPIRDTTDGFDESLLSSADKYLINVVSILDSLESYQLLQAMSDDIKSYVDH